MKPTLTLLASALLALPLALACGDKDGDDTGGTTGDGGGTTGDGGGTTDGGSGDGGTTDDYFEPNSMLIIWQTGIIEGAQGDVMYSGNSLGHYISFYLVNDDWGGFSDTRNFCMVTFDTTGATTLSDCTDCYAGAAWQVDTSTVLATDGDCDDLNPTDYPDVVGMIAGYDWAYGFGPASSSLESTILGYYPEYDGKIVAGYLKTSMGDTAWTEFDWALAYEVDSSGNLVKGDFLDQGGPVLPDGYYVSNPYYGFNL